MKNRGIVLVFTILLVVVSIYQLSFTWKASQVDKKAKEIAAQQGIPLSEVQDSLGPEVVYNLGIAEFTYLECKQKRLNLGLDLQGGMNVTLEVSVPDIVKALAEFPDDPRFNQALDQARAEFLGQQDFVSLFAEKFEAISPNTGLAKVFVTPKGRIKPTSTNEEVYLYLREEAKNSVDRAYQIIGTRVDEFGVTQPNVQQLDNGRISVELPGVDNPKRIRNILQSSAKLEFWETYFNYEAWAELEKADDALALVLDLDGDDSAAIEDNASAGLESLAVDSSELASQEASLNAIDSLNKDGVATDSGDTNIGSLTDADEAGADTGQMSAEEYRKANPLLSLVIPNISQDNQWQRSAAIGFVQAKDIDKFKKYLSYPEVQAALPLNIQFRWSFKPTEDQRFYQLYALKADRDGGPVLDGDVVQDARDVLERTGEIKVSMTMNVEGTKDWRRITAKAAQNQAAVAIVLDSAVYSAPTVNSEIPNGMSVIEGGFDQTEAVDLANILKAGKLPAPARIVEESLVGPSLGEKSIRAGLISLVVGFSLVILFMILYYSKAGVYAVIALLANLFFIIGVLSGYGAALTLPGMAGLVLTIGMAVDANVLIFERIKEELHDGRNFRAAVERGYKAARSSIIDANITTLIAGFILMAFGKGAVAGFAIILVIGIISSLFTAILLTRLFVDNDLKKGRETKFFSSFSEKVLKNANFNFIGNRKRYYIVSGVIILAGIVSLMTRGVSTGVDLEGGWSYVVQLSEDHSSDELREALETKFGDASLEVKTYGTDNQFKVTTNYMINSQSKEAGDTVEGMLVSAITPLGGSDSAILMSSKIGPTIAKDVRTDSTYAIILALIGMFAYIVLRFRKWAFGLGATIALFHDVLIVFSLYSIFWGLLPFSLEIDQAFIAAILTVVGYSINDTVVVFDRVREALGLKRHDEDTGDTINLAINQTLSRTLVTSLTTLLVILILFIFGGEGLKGFTFALLVGVATGTYSSLFIGTPIAKDLSKPAKGEN